MTSCNSEEKSALWVYQIDKDIFSNFANNETCDVKSTTTVDIFVVEKFGDDRYKVCNNNFLEDNLLFRVDFFYKINAFIKFIYSNN